jgi:hypothetical protein
MKVAISSILILLTVACTSDRADNEKLVEQIEQSIKLPESALEIQSYARYYAQKENTVYGSYIVHEDVRRQREAVKDECARFGIKSYPCNNHNYGVIEAGKYTWVGNRDDLPIILDGGCSQVDFEYDVRRNSFAKIACSGSY